LIDIIPRERYGWMKCDGAKVDIIPTNDEQN
jgi:hypothetical protein